jgi:hypothetical protein
MLTLRRPNRSRDGAAFSGITLDNVPICKSFASVTVKGKSAVHTDVHTNEHTNEHTNVLTNVHTNVNTPVG